MPQTREFKAQRVVEVLSGRKSAATIGREYQLKPDVLACWKADFVTHTAQVFAGEEAFEQADDRETSIAK